MGIRFKKSIKLNDLLKINISKSGISATVGKKGASVNIGGKGTFLNLSPTLLGIKGTGISYRQKITGGYSSLLGGIVSKFTGKNKDESKEEINSDVENNESQEKIDTNIDAKEIIDNYQNSQKILCNLNTVIEEVKSKDEIIDSYKNEENDALKDIYIKAINGDEDTIEQLIGSFIGNTDIGLDIDANYELEDDTLYVDLDLPEIDDLNPQYPILVKDKIEYKDKTQTELKEEYARIVLGLSVYLTANFFNISHLINNVIISGFTSRRDSNGDLKDTYIYSFKYIRKEFEKTNFKSIDLFNYYLQFENRINISKTYVFKEIKPYEMESVSKSNSLIDEAIEGLKTLGYKSSDINLIKDQLSNLKLESSSDYLKEALRLLKK